MMAEVRWFHSPDIDDLAQYVPDVPDCFSFLLQVMVGPAGSPGEESFDLEVCTPQWLCTRHLREDIVIGRHRLIVVEFNFKRIADFITANCRRCSGTSWQEVAEKVGRLGMWEFEDYQSTSTDT